MKVNIAPPTVEHFVELHRDFLEFIAGFREGLPVLKMKELIESAGSAEKVAIVTVDAVKGFCSVGPMSSPRVSNIIPEIKRIISNAEFLGVNAFIFPCDNHRADSKEFDIWPAHCIDGTLEAELEDQLLEMDISSKFTIIPKPAINSFIDTVLVDKIASLEPRIIVVMGDVTDLCLYQLATNLKMLAISRGWNCRVIVPLSAIETYDIPCDVAKSVGVMPHDADFINAMFAYHLQVTGVEVVKDIV